MRWIVAWHLKRHFEAGEEGYQAASFEDEEKARSFYATMRELMHSMNGYCRMGLPEEFVGWARDIAKSNPHD